MARWITIKESAVPFDYRWPHATAITAFTTAGEEFVKDEIADWAIAKGYATAGRKRGSTTRSKKGGPKARATTRRKSVKPVLDAAAPDLGRDDGLVRADHADDGVAARKRPMDPVAE